MTQTAQQPLCTTDLVVQTLRDVLPLVRARADLRIEGWRRAPQSIIAAAHQAAADLTDSLPNSTAERESLAALMGLIAILNEIATRGAGSMERIAKGRPNAHGGPKSQAAVDRARMRGGA